MNRVEAIEYDVEWNILNQKQFEWVEDAMEWCESRSHSPLEWNDTQIGYEGLTEANRMTLDDTGDYSDVIFQIHGIEENGAMREIESEDHRDNE